jgi:hypothetical protein
LSTAAATDREQLHARSEWCCGARG